MLRFASELKALLADPGMSRSIDPEALDCYLAMGFVPGDRCILKGVKKLPPAHALCFDLHSGEARLWRYWQLPEFSGGDAAQGGRTKECWSTNCRRCWRTRCAGNWWRTFRLASSSAAASIPAW